jgi:hypothetical protein
LAHWFTVSFDFAVFIVPWLNTDKNVQASGSPFDKSLKEKGSEPPDPYRVLSIMTNGEQEARSRAI